MNIIDISYTISPKLSGFPAEPRTMFSTFCDIKNDCPVKVSEISFSTHIGTHIDSPSHYIQNGLTIDQLPLQACVGPCIVIDLKLFAKQNPLKSITSDSINTLKLAPRVLFKTESTDLTQGFPETFPYLANECIEYLASHNTVLIGLDTPSIDHYDSKDLPAHHLCSQYNIQILENLNLSKVSPGYYTLIALPLKLEGLDASPVRAILIQKEDTQNEI